MAGAKERQRRGGGRKANLSPFSLSLSTHGFDERLPACSLNQLSLKALTLFLKRVLCNISLPDIQMKKAIATETLFNYFRERACHSVRGWQFFTRASLLSPCADIEFSLIAIELPSFFPFLKKKCNFIVKYFTVLTDTLKRVHSGWDPCQLPHKENSWLTRCTKFPDLNTKKDKESG